MWTKITTSKENKVRFKIDENPDFTRRIEVPFRAEVDTRLTYQTMMGFGGAFTEAAAITLNKMSRENRKKVLKAYFDQQEGLGYNIGRVHIHSCDFALGNYTYVEDGDDGLESFNIDHDRELIIPFIEEARALRGENIRLLASPWSPPAWMKTTGEMNHGGKLLDRYRQSWANYYVKFIEAYEDAGIPIWGMTVQNEPEAVQTWESCLYTAEEERDFVRDYLGPTLWKAGLQDKKLLIWDHNRDVMVNRVKTVLDDPVAAKYIWGTGFHWYMCEDFENAGKVHELFPDKHLLFTEGCQEGGVHLGKWHTGERYARNMIGDFNNWCEGHLDWNLVLDETGGPSHVNNLCDAPIICDTTADTVIFNSSYYYIGHFSKYVKPGAKRVFADCPGKDLWMTAFVNPDGSLVIVLMNEGDERKDLSLNLDGEKMDLTIDRHSIETYLRSNG